MKIFTTNSRFSYGILLVLLIASVAGSFVILHNQITEAQAKTPLFGILLILASIVIAIVFYYQLSIQLDKLQKGSQELLQLKKTIQQSKKDEEIIEVVEKSENITEINYEQEALELIPKEEFASEEKFLEKLLSYIAKKHDIVQGVAFKKNSNTKYFELVASYAYFSEYEPPKFVEGETLPGQVAKNKVVLNLAEVPEEYITILSGLGKGSPSNLLIVPVVNEDNDTVRILEFASFVTFSADKVKVFETLGNILNQHITTIGNSIEE
jgi:hypothetical protein